MDFAIGFGAGFVLVGTVTMQYGDIADKRWRAVLYEPVVALSAIVGMGEALAGFPGAAGYIIGSTLATAVAMYLRRRGV